MNFNEFEAYLDAKLAAVEYTANTSATALECKVDRDDFNVLSKDYYNTVQSINLEPVTQGISAIWGDLSDVYQRLEALEEAVRRLQQPNPTTIESLL